MTAENTPAPGADHSEGGADRKAGRAVGDTGNGTAYAGMIAAIIEAGPRFEWRLTYRRAGWAKPSTRIWQSKPAAERHAAKLQAQDRDHSRLVLLRVDQRPVGAWSEVTRPVDEGEVTRHGG